MGKKKRARRFLQKFGRKFGRKFGIFLEESKTEKSEIIEEKEIPTPSIKKVITPSIKKVITPTAKKRTPTTSRRRRAKPKQAADPTKKKTPSKE